MYLNRFKNIVEILLEICRTDSVNLITRTWIAKISGLSEAIQVTSNNNFQTKTVIKMNAS